MRGYNFQEQWQRAFAIAAAVRDGHRLERMDGGPLGCVPASRLLSWTNTDEEFSRDIEPMNGGHGDNYYYQLIANVRRYKGVPALPSSSAGKNHPSDRRLRAMAGSAAGISRSMSAKPRPRDFDGAGGMHYTNVPAATIWPSAKLRAMRPTFIFTRARSHRSPRSRIRTGCGC